MSLNGITGYNNYSYSNPYAVNNTYANTYSNAGTTAFQGYDPTAMYSTTATAEKEDSGNPLLAIGAGIAAIGTAIYSIKKGKKLNIAGLGEDVVKNSDNFKGLKGVWKNLTTGVKSIFTKTGREASKAVKENTVIKELAEKAQKEETLKVTDFAGIYRSRLSKLKIDPTSEEARKYANEFLEPLIDKETQEISKEKVTKLLDGLKKTNDNAISSFLEGKK